jgi:hypothetical protein
MALNALAPGAGLVLLRREWLGLSICLLFGLLAQLALWGLFIVPANVPRAVSMPAAVGAAVIWGWAQWLLVLRARVVLGPVADEAIEVLLARAREALKQGQYQRCGQFVRLARSIDDGHADVQHVWAHLLTLTGRFADARRAWERLLLLDPPREVRRTAVDALEKLPDA